MMLKRGKYPIHQMVDLTEIQAKILEILEFGKEKAVTQKELHKRLPTYSERKIRLTIESLRNEKWPILSSASPPYGYYLPSQENYDAEVDEWLEMMKSYIIELCRTRRDVKVGALERKNRQVQLPLWEGA